MWYVIASKLLLLSPVMSVNFSCSLKFGQNHSCSQTEITNAQVDTNYFALSISMHAYCKVCLSLIRQSWSSEKMYSEGKCVLHCIKGESVRKKILVRFTNASFGLRCFFLRVLALGFPPPESMHIRTTRFRLSRLSGRLSGNSEVHHSMRFLVTGIVML